MLHIAPVLSTHLVERPGDLTQGGAPHRLHQFGEDVAVGAGDLLEPRQCQGCLFPVRLLEGPQVRDLGVFLFCRGARQFPRKRIPRFARVGAQEGVDADYRSSPECFLCS